MPARKKQEVAVVEDAALPVIGNQAAYNATIAGALGSLDEADLIIPRLKLLQGLSKEVSDGLATSGNWFNNVSQDNYGKELDVVVVTATVVRFYMPPGEGLLCRATKKGTQPLTGVGDPGGLCDQCELSQWIGKTPPACNQGYQYYVFNVDEYGAVTHEFPMALSMISSAAKVGKNWNTMLRVNTPRNAPPWAIKYTLGVKKQENEHGTFFVPTVSKAEDQTIKPDVHPLCFTYVQRLASEDIAVVETDQAASGTIISEEDEDGLDY